MKPRIVGLKRSLPAIGLLVGLLIGLVTRTALAEPMGTPRPSGYDFMSPALRNLQRDEAQNPGMLAVREGQALWQAVPPSGGPACAKCHGAAVEDRMRGAAARYPVWDRMLNRPVTLSQRVEQCRQQHQGQTAQAPEGPERLALTAAVARASVGQPLQPDTSAPMQRWREEGARLWGLRVGQLDLSCSQCHDDQVGRRLGGSVIPPGNSVGYPTYRLEWQALGSVQRRLRNCMTSVRAQPFAPDSDPALALEVFMAWRDRGLALEVPAVRP